MFQTLTQKRIQPFILVAPSDFTNPHAALSVGATAYTYDKNGNLLGFGTTPNNTVLTYNYRNELGQYQKMLPTPINMTMLYDYKGDRIQTVDSAGTSYNPNKYYEENGGTKSKYIFLNDQLVATIEKIGINSPTAQYIHPDHLGGTVVVTDQLGNKVQDLEYYPFGSIRTNSGTFNEKHKFTGHEFDTDTSLNFMEARYQNGNEGRFWQQDPVFINLDKDKLPQFITDPQLQNSYGYSRNNPLKYIDQDGKWIETASDIASLSLSINDYRNHPSWGNAGFVGLDVLGTALPGIPAFVGYARHGDDAIKGVKEIQKIAKESNWGSHTTLVDHATRHAKDFGLKATNYKGYAKSVDNFLSKTEDALKINKTNFDSFVDIKGRTFMFNKNNSMMGIKNANGTSATAYKPKNGDSHKALNYWNKQKAQKAKK